MAWLPDCNPSVLDILSICNPSKPRPSHLLVSKLSRIMRQTKYVKILKQNMIYYNNPWFIKQVYQTSKLQICCFIDLIPFLISHRK